MCSLREPGSQMHSCLHPGLDEHGRLLLPLLHTLVTAVYALQGLMRKPEDEDVRAKILRHEGNSEQFKAFTAAYAQTQPKPIYAPEENEEEEQGS